MENHEDRQYLVRPYESHWYFCDRCCYVTCATASFDDVGQANRIQPCFLSCGRLLAFFCQSACRCLQSSNCFFLCPVFCCLYCVRGCIKDNCNNSQRQEVENSKKKLKPSHSCWCCGYRWEPHCCIDCHENSENHSCNSRFWCENLGRRFDESCLISLDTYQHNSGECTPEMRSWPHCCCRVCALAAEDTFGARLTSENVHAPASITVPMHQDMD